MRNPNLDFDLGLTCYKLGRYAEARVAFERLEENAGYASIAKYHLALVDARTGEDERAIVQLRDVEAHADSARLRELAQVALHRIGGETALPTWSAYATLGLGYDSDPLLVSEAVRDAVNQKADAFAALQAGVDVPLAATATTVLATRVDLYARQYLHDTELSQQGAEAGLHELFGGNWRTDLSLLAATAFVGGNNLENSGGLALRTARAFGDSTFRIGYRLDRIAGASGYGYLTGWRHRLTTDYAWPLAATRARVDYELEANDRRDLEQGGQFFSQSPTRHGIELRDRLNLNASIELEARARYRYSDYRDADVFLDGTTTVERKRKENLLQAAIAGRWRLNPAWDVAVEYEFSHNRSNFEGFTYDRHLLSVAVEWLR